MPSVVSTPQRFLRAIHVNHHWQHASDQWAKWCLEHCQQWDIDYVTLDIQLTQNNNIEEHARILRYQAIETVLDEHEALLLGHHADDQGRNLHHECTSTKWLSGVLAPWNQVKGVVGLFYIK